MSFVPVLHDATDSVRFGRILFVELVPGPSPGDPGRYENVLTRRDRMPSRVHFSAPEKAASDILRAVDRGMAVDAVVFGGPGDPLRHRGIGTVLRRVRTSAHLETVILSDGLLLADRDVRREVGEAGLVVAWMPALEDSSEKPSGLARSDAWERHAEGIAALHRETPTRIALELPIRPGVNDGAESLAAWRRGIERVRPDRVFLVPAPGVPEDAVAATLDLMRAKVHPRAGAFLSDGTIVDQRVFSAD